MTTSSDGGDLEQAVRDLGRTLGDLIAQLTGPKDPPGWERGGAMTSRFYRYREDDLFRMAFGPSHVDVGFDGPWGWWWRISFVDGPHVGDDRGVAGGWVEDQKCRDMQQMFKLVDGHAQEIRDRFAEPVPGWTWDTAVFGRRTRTQGGLVLSFEMAYVDNPCSFSRWPRNAGWYWTWRITDGGRDRELASGRARSSQHFDFAAVARFVEAEAEKINVSLDVYR